MPRAKQHRWPGPARRASAPHAGWLLTLALSAPGTAADTRLVLGGRASATLSPVERGYFNYTDYSESALRQLRLTLEAELRHGRRLALVAAVRSVNLGTPVATALYVRLRPWAARPVDLQAGRIPPVFGSYARRGYAAESALVGLPLPYQYLTTLRHDARPPSADALLRWRGGGWQPYYAPGLGPGLPLVHGDLWDTGVEVRLGTPRATELSLALTRGSLSRPLVADDNGRPQISARLARAFGPALTLGLSAARGAYRASDAWPGSAPAVPPRDDLQRALAFDFEYARGHGSLRGEALFVAWDAPGAHVQALRATGVSVEGQWRLHPLLDVAARVDRLDFARIAGATLDGPWDAPVWRLESGLSARLRRGLRAQAVYQHNWRDGGRVRSEGLAAARLELRF